MKPAFHKIDNAMDNLMDASTAIDHDRHIEISAKLCEKYQKEKGYFRRREPFAVFKRPGEAAIISKHWFTKSAWIFVAEMLLIENNALVDHAMVF